MNNLNNKGFTLVELIATVVVLAIVMSVGAISITTIINNSKEKDYKILIDEINSATEEYYIECTFDDKSNLDCPTLNSGYYYITLGELVRSGFLKGNSSDDSDKLIVVNTKDNKDISTCQVRYKYENAKIMLEAVNPEGSCPLSY